MNYIYGRECGKNEKVITLADAEALENENKSLREALADLKRGDCWCEVAIGNPMCRGEHSSGCKKAQAIMGG
jgi:hypothetical protein